MNDPHSLSPECLSLKQALTESIIYFPEKERDEREEMVREARTDKTVRALAASWPIPFLFAWTIITPDKHKEFAPKLAGDQIMSRGDWEMVVDDGEFSEGFTYRRKKEIAS